MLVYIEKKESDTGFEYSIRKTLFKKIFEWILVTVIFLLAFGIMALITYNYDKGLFAIFCIGIGIFWAVILFQISNTSSLIIDNDGKLIKINDLQITRDFEDMLILRRVISIDQSQSHKPSSGGRNNAAYKQKWQIQY